MGRTPRIIFGLPVIVLAVASFAFAQKTRNTPTQAEWTAMAKLPDFSGVWEQGGGGGGGARGGGAAAPAGGGGGGGPAAPAGGGGRGAAPAAGARGGRGGGGAEGPSLTPDYATKQQAEAAARQANRAEDNETANCLPPGLPGIMGQPYPIEILLTPG